MKFPDFRYAVPSSVAEAVELLAESKGEAKLLAGGQSLLPVLAFRLAAPSLLIDLKELIELRHITLDETGVRLGALARWRDIERDARLRKGHPLLQEAIAHTAHYQIRNRGTVGGSISHADPAAELPGIAVTCDAEIFIVGPSGQRTVAANDFFIGALSTILEPEEIVIEVRLPRWKPGRRWAFQEYARRRGDFAFAGIALHYDVDSGERVTNAHIGVIGACQKPHRVPSAEAELNGKILDANTCAAACQALFDALDPPSDLHASADYRRALARTLLERVLNEANTRHVLDLSGA